MDKIILVSMELTIVALLAGVALAFPLASASMAKSFGRSYWKWFCIGCVLPIAANIILLFIPSPQTINLNKNK